MLERLSQFYEQVHNKKQSLVLELTHDKVADWTLCIYHRDSKAEIYINNGVSLNYLCTDAYVALRNWCEEYEDLCEIEPNLS